ncbi:Sec1-like protein [Fragilariopsis cylindrus CCMP1102]|uniref:Sec1-like protein n=1 Tax=Fragilariopsis cylindrus CCMP1102 TaxID=635003 RepID=A0A1E7FWV0_9STRA|nr:Sec1-like protein [Fragilariopsis cylindrus CCMP1102]|eukprot:OEU22632.1 Sec1-like protein [Fragilariopsis cylindrus CCMP1102]
MLGFNEDVDAADDDYSLPPAGSSHNQWKILIYDNACRSIISPLLSVSQLRRRGVTLHLLLNSEREPIPDVPAVYFCRPTKENLSIIAQDSARGLYGRSHLNFVTKLDRPLMEDFAKLVVQSGTLETIAGMHDQYLDFVCLEQQLFSLSKKDSYALYNGSGVSEQMIEEFMNDIAYGLFSVVATQGKVPIIRCPKGGAPEMVARKLNRMIAEHPTLLRNKSSGLHRPLLVILDRNADLITPIQHTSTYQALIDDMLKHKANRVEFDVTTDMGGKRPKTVQKKFDLDPDQDPFYSRHKFHPFPEAIESNGVDLQEVSAKEQSIRSKAAGNEVPDPSSSTTDLATAVDSLPALLDRKKQLEVHTSILQAVMNQVAARDVPQFFELETSLATGSYSNDSNRAKNDVLKLVADPSKGNVEDKLRLVVVYVLTTNAKTADVDEVAAAVQQAMEGTGDDGKSRLDKEGKQRLEVGSKALGSVFSSVFNKATSQATGLLAKAADRVTSMLGKTHKHYATQVVENLCEMKPGTEDDDYLYLDPRVKGDVDVQKLRLMNRSPVHETTAFVIGGGCYAEYQNLQMVANDRRTISYGSTELLDAGEFLEQLGKLGS